MKILNFFLGLCYLVSTGFHGVGLILALIMIGNNLFYLIFCIFGIIIISVVFVIFVRFDIICLVGLRCKEIPLEDSQRSLKR